jgi:D-alanine-D-alanine ligase
VIRRSKGGVPAALRRRRIGLLFGGWSAERPISLKSAAAVDGALRRLRLPHAKIDVTPRVAEQVRRAGVDLAFLVLHGPFGEDGALQGLLDGAGVAYTGSGVRASSAAMHKPTAKGIFQAHGIPTPPWRVLHRRDSPLARKQDEVLIVKPAAQGSAIGVSVVRRPSEWKPALRNAFRHSGEVLVERYVPGTEVTVAVLGDRALPVVEIIPKHGFYDFFSKYAKGGSAHIVPARLPDAVLARCRSLSLRAFRALGCRHLARVDLMVPKNGRPTVLEVNTLPGMTATSLFPDAARAAGMDFDALVLEILKLALADAPASRRR